MFGGSFQAAYLPLVILSLSQLVSAASGAVGFMLGMGGQERLAARLTIIAGVVNVLLNALMIPAFGMVGAAVATATAGILWNILLIRGVSDALGIRPTILG